MRLARQLGAIGLEAAKDPYEAVVGLRLLRRAERDSLDLTLAVRNESQHAYEHLEARFDAGVTLVTDWWGGCGRVI